MIGYLLEAKASSPYGDKIYSDALYVPEREKQSEGAKHAENSYTALVVHALNDVIHRLSDHLRILW